MNKEDLNKLRKNLSKKEKLLLAENFEISYETLGNILRGYVRSHKAEEIFIAAARMINERKAELTAASTFIQGL